ncbi:MAG: copper resistance protein CopC, partial [Solirubrobacterales bacterium]|nr:copper resistance protein CopC [Solirubrobacterales bacterium]
MHRVVSSACLLAGALAALLLAAPGASAHAQLKGATPAAGAALAHAPRQVVFRFSEPVEGRFGAVTVYDGRGTRVSGGHAGHVNGVSSTFGTTLPADLPAGRYAATYRVISADGHPISGGIVFSVGGGVLRGAGPSLRRLLGGTEAGPVTRGAFAAVRALDDLATALAIGLLCFLLWCWRPALRAASGGGRDWRKASEVFAAGSTRLLRSAIAAGAATAYLGILFQGAVADGSTLWAALDPAVLADTLATRFGIVWAAKLAMWIALGGALVRVAPLRAFALRPAALGADGLALGRPGAGQTLALALPAGVLALAPALAGHASTQGDAPVLVPALVVHVVAMSAWLGGLVALLLLVPRAAHRLTAPADRTRLLVAVLERFSPLALGAVLALVSTGTLQSVLYLHAFGDLVREGFGRAVLAKILLVLALVVLGAVNRRRAVPRLQRLAGGDERPGGPGRLLRRTVATEIVLLLGALAATGIL